MKKGVKIIFWIIGSLIIFLTIFYLFKYFTVPSLKIESGTKLFQINSDEYQGSPATSAQVNAIDSVIRKNIKLEEKDSLQYYSNGDTYYINVVKWDSGPHYLRTYFYEHDGHSEPKLVEGISNGLTPVFFSNGLLGQWYATAGTNIWHVKENNATHLSISDYGHPMVNFKIFSDEKGNWYAANAAGFVYSLVGEKALRVEGIDPEKIESMYIDKEGNWYARNAIAASPFAKSQMYLIRGTVAERIKPTLVTMCKKGFTSGLNYWREDNCRSYKWTE